MFYSLTECKSFIASFDDAVVHNKYVTLKPSEAAFTYESTEEKPSGFKTEEITRYAAGCVAFLHDEKKVGLEEKTSLIQTLNKALAGYSDRVTKSIQARWWYAIAHVFGYQAKVPEPLQAAISDVQRELQRLKGEQKQVKIKPQVQEPQHKA